MRPARESSLRATQDAAMDSDVRWTPGWPSARRAPRSPPPGCTCESLPTSSRLLLLDSYEHGARRQHVSGEAQRRQGLDGPYGELRRSAFGIHVDQVEAIEGTYSQSAKEA